MIRLIDERVMEKLRDKAENIDLEEFVPLVGEWREDKASKAKCPYCVEPILLRFACSWAFLRFGVSDIAHACPRLL